ncbi:winged helix DNA-binding protein [Pelagibius sp. Alg239-R121]|uniref:winged helix DNA-binding protein n=1 Tax=Pelagibius sp. Alg239-R121 TaxID=2993448 RepID=UPI0024A7644E|nr:winged helix DNA-binding protein [Pelagibius sp. Alg239-R121]
MTGDTDSRRSFVASAHLVSEKATELSEFEFGLIIASNAFNRWIVRCMSAAGYGDLNSLDIEVLHSVNHRARDKKLADLCFILNVEDTHTVSYALKKLIRLGLVGSTRSGKEISYGMTEDGRDACERYRQIREDCLVKSIGAFGKGTDAEFNQQVGQVADVLRALSGLYDQAARSAASL